MTPTQKLVQSKMKFFGLKTAQQTVAASNLQVNYEVYTCYILCTNAL